MDTQHRGVITTISGGGASMAEGSSSERRGSCDLLAVCMKVGTTPPSVITFGERDMRYEPPQQDKPMVISVVTIEYKVEREVGAPVDQPGSMLRNVVRGVIELETTFGERGHARSILVLYMVVDAEASYNIIMGRPALNKFGAVVSTLHLCMKYLVG
ncbi:hypothetical protein CR513_37919, partial [Mucuna pruriens]